MYKSIYVCDCCGEEMQTPMYTLELKTNSFCVQNRVSWHYCNDCWGYIKKGLTKKNELSDLVLEKAVERFKEANKEQDKATKWYELLFALALNESAQQEKKSITWKPPYNLCTITTTTSDEGKITQGKPIINNDKYTYSSPYTSYTISTSGEETIQAKPAGDGPFTVGCCCENTNKDSLNYKQTTGI